MSTWAQPGRLRRPGRGLKTVEKLANSQFSKPPHTQNFGHPPLRYFERSIGHFTNFVTVPPFWSTTRSPNNMTTTPAASRPTPIAVSIAFTFQES
mgnify:CR=1 FL=1